MKAVSAIKCGLMNIARTWYGKLLLLEMLLGILRQTIRSGTEF